MNENVEIRMIVINTFGEFIGRKTLIDKEDYINICKIAKSFYNTGGFELSCEDGSYMIFAPNIVQNSILKIEKYDL